MSLHSLLPFNDIDGKSISPSIFHNKVVFVMNVASACGYTKPGYDLLAHLTTKYPPSDFLAVAIPCNAFGRQESGSADEIKTFALARADKLLITERSEVNGDSAHPIFKVAAGKFPAAIRWNFDGRLVFGKDGAPIARFGNGSSVADIEAAIDKAI